MSELVLAVYDREDTAEHVLALIHAQRDDVQIDFESAAIVRVGTDGGITVTTTDQLGSGKSLWGVLWEALFGLIFLVPGPADGLRLEPWRPVWRNRPGRARRGFPQPRPRRAGTWDIRPRITCE